MRASKLIVPIVILIAAFVSLASAQSDWALAMQPDKSIQAKLAETTSVGAPGDTEASAVILLHENDFEVFAGTHKHYRSVVFQVNNPAELGTELLSPYLGAHEAVEQSAAFVIRQGKIERLSADRVRIEAGDGAILRSRLHLDVANLQAGDMVGWSTISTTERLLYNAVIPCAAKYPVVSAVLRIRDVGTHNYDIRGPAIPDFRVQATEPKHDRPTLWYARAESIAAVPDLRLNGPYTPETPLFLLSMAEQYGAMGSQDWVPTLSWSRVALWLSGIRELGVGKMIAASGKATDITKDLADPLAKEQAIFEFVRDGLKTINDDAYDRLGSRTADLILASGEATEMEKAMMMVTLLDAIGLPGEIAAIRPESWGPLDGVLESFVSFRELGVRCGMEKPRFYTPQFKDSVSAQLPEAWGNAWILSARTGMTQRMYEFSAQLQPDQLEDIRELFVTVQEKAHDQGWVRMERAR